jgi:hypothetical protein
MKHLISRLCPFFRDIQVYESFEDFELFFLFANTEEDMKLCLKVANKASLNY